MIKEAMVEIDEFIEQNKLNACILACIHDEIVTKQEKRIDGISQEFHNSPILYRGTKLDLPKFVADKMVEVANRYLTNVKMGVEYKVKDYWDK